MTRVLLFVLRAIHIEESLKSHLPINLDDSLCNVHAPMRSKGELNYHSIDEDIYTYQLLDML